MNQKKIIVLIISIISIIIIYILIKINIYHKDKLYVLKKVPEINMLNQHGKMWNNQKILKNKVYIIRLFFTSCKGLCIKMNNEIYNIEKNINNNNFKIVSVTINPKIDNYKILELYHKNILNNNKNWILLTTKNIKYLNEILSNIDNIKRINKNYSHSDRIILVDKNGNIRYKYINNKPHIYYNIITNKRDINELEKDIKKLLKE